MKKVAIVDSRGSQEIHEEYKDRLSHVTFHGVSPTGYANRPIHGHGGWCGWDWLAQETDQIECLFVQIFDENGVGGIVTDEWWMDALKDFGLKPGDGMNASWGAHPTDAYDENILKAMYNQMWIDELQAALNGATCYFAAGNDGKVEQNYPQKVLVGIDNIHIVAAVNEKGVRSSFSSTAAVGERYPDFAFFGEGGLSLDADTGQVLSWSGTSKASPNAGGAFSSNDVFGSDVKEYARQHTLGDDDNDGIPNGINAGDKDLIESGGFHHEVGVGVCEGIRQRRMRITGQGLGVYDARGRSLQMKPSYLDFERI